MHSRPTILIIEHGRVVDGTGAPWFAADVGIRAGRVAAIGQLDKATAKRRIDAAGRVVAPGFIDMLGQSELTLLVNPHVPSKIFQGITTEITGEGRIRRARQCRDRQGSGAPIRATTGLRRTGPTSRVILRGSRSRASASTSERTSARRRYARWLSDIADRAATPDELTRMQAIVATAMRQGALGVSSALEYAPAPYASTEELIALASTAAQFGGIYATHMRSEQESIMTSIDETIRIGREAHIPVEIWHLKAGGVELRPDAGDRRTHRPRARRGRGYRGRHLRLSGLVQRARRRSFPPGRTTAATRNSSSGSGSGDSCAPQDGTCHRATDWDNEWQSVPGPEAILITTVLNPKLVDLQGHSLAEIAKARGTDPMDTLFDILIEDGARTYVAVFAMSEPDIALAAVQPWVSFCNDSEGTSPDGLLGTEFPHPRAYGTFPRVLRKYVREERRMSPRRGDPQIHRACLPPVCVSMIEVFSRLGCGPMSWCSIRSRSRTRRPSVRRSSSRSACNGCWSTGYRSSRTALQPMRCPEGFCAGRATGRRVDLARATI